jgi:hypothetical protein
MRRIQASISSGFTKPSNHVEEAILLKIVSESVHNEPDLIARHWLTSMSAAFYPEARKVLARSTGVGATNTSGTDL